MPFSPATLADYQRDGYVIVPGLLDREEVSALSRVARARHEADQGAARRADGEGGAIRLVVENELRDDIFGAIVRSRRIVVPMMQLLQDEVYHYHHKLILKEARTGGAWAWHQDYGYWYSNGCLSADLASCLITIDRATRANGCLQVVPGSHRLGRMEHMKVGDQTGADPERVAAVLERFPLVYVELEPGDAIFFHSNLLHRSDQNHSPDPRWAFICCYNARHNDPYKESRHPRYAPLEIWPDERILEYAPRG
jgi:ectoine hydroxylase-related dioxygenase (phytanoyl-CoA dioxygenase family)